MHVSQVALHVICCHEASCYCPCHKWLGAVSNHSAVSTDESCVECNAVGLLLIVSSTCISRICEECYPENAVVGILHSAQVLKYFLPDAATLPFMHALGHLKACFVLWCPSICSTFVIAHVPVRSLYSISKVSKHVLLLWQPQIATASLSYLDKCVRCRYRSETI